MTLRQQALIRREIRDAVFGPCVDPVCAFAAALTAARLGPVSLRLELAVLAAGATALRREITRHTGERGWRERGERGEKREERRLVDLASAAQDDSVRQSSQSRLGPSLRLCESVCVWCAVPSCTPLCSTACCSFVSCAQHAAERCRIGVDGMRQTHDPEGFGAYHNRAHTDLPYRLTLMPLNPPDNTFQAFIG